ncbi:hypothetical protein B0H17DRAFT_1216507 [Mycena rosella]|uniref:Uncharacterized protein n=1 Tax=Mycena rosella TaxID=1033263 RepID=A0AAD7FSK0_MYCRO|nr:hypothetical protein B0H17DRAFT_1216507 [Mycena rosella]
MKASLYNPKEHWLGWTPVLILPTTDESPMNGMDDDPIDFLFDNEDIGMTPVMYDAYNEDSDGSQNVAIPKIAGYNLAKKWVDLIQEWSDRLHRWCRKLAENSIFYARRAGSGELGDLPSPVNMPDIRSPHASMADAQKAAQRAKAMLLSMLGFISWFLTIQDEHLLGLTAKDQHLIRSFRLGD